MIDLSNTQCPSCKASQLSQQSTEINVDTIHDRGILCSNCGKHYAIIWGVPYIGVFSLDEILSLIEIAAVSDEFSISNKELNVDYLFWIKLINEYCLDADTEKIMLKYNITQKPDWFDHRVNDHKWFKFLTSAIELKERDVLDVGAGSGYDSLNIHLSGANVTSLEFNPILSGLGLHNYGQFRWFGGSAHNIPFADEQFDMVIANATLHHLIDIPRSVSEMIRVLRPGGHLITISDSFSNNDMTEELEANIFNNNTAVLMGTNERVPRFEEFISTLKKYQSCLDIQIFTQGCNNNISYPHQWQLEDAMKKLPNANGSISFVVKKKASIKIAQPEICNEFIKPADYARCLNNQSSSISGLSDCIPEKFLDLSLLANNYSKFRLLNGWKLHLKGDNKRVAYLRARSFFSIQKAKFPYVSISLLVPYLSDYDIPEVSIKINNEIIYARNVIRGIWHDLIVPISGKIQSKKAFAFEIHLSTSITKDEARLFYVRKIDFTSINTSHHKDDNPELEDFGIESLCDAGLIGPETCMLCATDFDHGLNIINKLRKMDFKVNIIVAQSQEAFYSWIPDIRIVDFYRDPNSNSAGPNISLSDYQIQLIAGSDISSIKYLYNLASANSGNGSSHTYIVLPGGHAKKYEEGVFKENKIIAALDNSRSDLTLLKSYLKKIPFMLQLYNKLKKFSIL